MAGFLGKFFGAGRPARSDSIPAPAEPSPGEIAKRIVQLIDLGADPDAISELYAGFERMYPQASLGGEAQLRVARILEDSQCRLLAIEAYRKACGDPALDSRPKDDARMALAGLLSRSPASCGDALRVIKQIHSDPTALHCKREANRLEGEINAMLGEIYPRRADGSPGPRPEGPCCILAQTLAKVPIPTVGTLLAARLKKNPMDVKSALARVPGILARDVPPRMAEKLAHEIQEMGLPVIVAGEDNCPDLPAAEQASSVQVDASGIGSFVLSGGARAEVNLADLAHAQFGLIGPPPHSGICDLYFFDPPRRIQLYESYMPRWDLGPSTPHAPAPTFQGLLKRLLRRIPAARLNHTLDLLFSDGDFQPITHRTPQEFAVRSQWLFLLAYNGAAAE